MSTISNALNNWLQRQGASVMRQAMLTANATEQERLELELAELGKLTRCKTLEKCPDPQWRIIRDETIEHKGQTFHRQLWTAICGGSIEYTEELVEGERVYQVERFELKPVSWAKGKVLAWPCSHIVSDTYNTKEEALAKVEFHKESIKPFWWKVKGRGEKSIMHQEATVCEALPPNTQEQMIAISIDSAHKIREMGAAITHDYTLGRVFTGTMDKVLIPRPEGTIGTYHTHPFGAPFPGITDTLEVINRDDKITCIGSTGKPGTKIQCFTRNKPKWDDLQFKFRLLVDDIGDYNGKLDKKYKQRGISLRKLLEGVGSPIYLGRIQYVTPEELENEAIIAEKSANAADEAIKMAIIEAGRAAESVKVAHIELGKAITEEEINEAKFNIRAKEEEVRRATARTIIERELTIDARAAADEAAFKAKVLALGKAEATAANRDANEHLREGANLARRRDVLEGEIIAQLRELAAPKDWKAHKWTNGFSEVPFFEAYPNMFNKCRVIWEQIEEELPYEL